MLNNKILYLLLNVVLIISLASSAPAFEAGESFGSTLKNHFTNFGSKMKEFGTSFNNHLSTHFGSFGEGLGSAKSSAIDAFSSGKRASKNFINENIKPAFSGLTETWNNEVQPKLNNIKLKARNFVDGSVKPALGITSQTEGNLKVLSNMGFNAVDNAGLHAKSFIDSVGGSGTANYLHSGISSAVGGGMDALRSAGNYLYSAVPQFRT